MYIAIKSFSGIISMRKNQIKEIKNKKLINDLVNAGYIEEYKENSPKEIKKENADLKKELDNANALIEKLNNEIESLKNNETSDEEEKEN